MKGMVPQAGGKEVNRADLDMIQVPDANDTYVAESRRGRTRLII